jgi:hypothetical protein
MTTRAALAKRLEGRLRVWLPAARFSLRRLASNGVLPPFAALTDAGFGFLLEAWLAEEAAKHFMACDVRLGDDPPDFQLRMADGRVRSFECVEADKPNRRRGQEYKEARDRAQRGEDLVEHDPDDAVLKRAKLASDALRAAAAKKARQVYPRDYELLFYLNLGTYGAYSDMVLPQVHSATECVRMRFTRVWMLWSGRIFAVWENGHQVPISSDVA